MRPARRARLVVAPRVGRTGEVMGEEWDEAVACGGHVRRLNLWSANLGDLNMYGATAGVVEAEVGGERWGERWGEMRAGRTPWDW